MKFEECSGKTMIVGIYDSFQKIMKEIGKEKHHGQGFCFTYMDGKNIQELFSQTKPILIRSYEKTGVFFTVQKKISDQGTLVDILTETESPVIVYAPGFSFIENRLGVSFSKLSKNYRKRFSNPNFFQQLDIAMDRNKLEILLEQVFGEIDSLLEQNPNSKIFVCGLSSSYHFSEYELMGFKKLILNYNEMLRKRCFERGIVYFDVDTQNILFTKLGMEESKKIKVLKK